MFLLEDYTLWYADDDMFGDACSGYNVVLASTPIKIATNVRHASKGFNNTSFITNDNKLYVYWYNDAGEVEIGEPSYVGKYTSQATHIGHVLGVLTGGYHFTCNNFRWLALLLGD